MVKLENDYTTLHYRERLSYQDRKHSPMGLRHSNMQPLKYMKIDLIYQGLWP
jgi:hypothetical protein